MKVHNASVRNERAPLQDRCGIVAFFGPGRDRPFFPLGLESLHYMQIRGYDGAGVVLVDSQGTVSMHKGQGMVSQVFGPGERKRLNRIRAEALVGQVRYGTSGNFNTGNVQPFSETHISGDVFVVAHNGQFAHDPNTLQNGQSDTHKFVQKLAANQAGSWSERIRQTVIEQKGAYSLIIYAAHQLYLIRDSFGIRPLVYGSITKKDGTVWMGASETSALERMGFTSYQEVVPGTIVRISENGSRVIGKSSSTFANCIFENVYIQDGRSKVIAPRKDAKSIQNSMTVDTARYRSGQILARESPVDTQPNKPYVVIGIPGTGISGGHGFADTLHLPYEQAIMDNTGPENEKRTFMHADIASIYKEILQHFSFEVNKIKGNIVILVDDSIVRGNISTGLTKLIRRLGASEVHWRVLSPPIDKPCHLGINTRHSSELIAALYAGDIDAIRRAIYADSLAYLSVAGLKEAITGNPLATGFCMGCMVGQRPPFDKYGQRVKHLEPNGEKIPYQYAQS